MRFVVMLLVALVAMMFMMHANPASAQSVSCDVDTISLWSNGAKIVTKDVSGSTVDDTSFTVDLTKLPNGKITYTADLDPETIDIWGPDIMTWDLGGMILATQIGNLQTPLLHEFSVNTACGFANSLRLRLQNQIFDNAHVVIDHCNHSYSINLINPACPSVKGDPQFAGLLGQSFQVHGVDGAVYALISAPTFLVNSRFQFLEGPRACPIMPSSGVKSQACWTHAGSYLGAVGVRTAAGDVLVIESGPASSGFALVQLNNKSLAQHDLVQLANNMGSVVFNSTHELTMTVGMFTIEVENIDGFVNLRSVRVSPSQWSQLAAQRVHGLLGQTWQSRRYAGSIKDIEGDVDDYVVDSDSLTGHEFVFNRFVVSS